MVSLCIEVGNGTGSLKVVARARNIERAVQIVAELYPGSRIEVEFPINSEFFFADDAATEGLISTVENVERRAA